MSIFKKIKDMEASVYPEDAQCYQEFKFGIISWLTYLWAIPHFIIGKDWYCVYTRKEVVDLASTGRMDLVTLGKIWKKLKSFYKGRPFEMYARESTSYQFIMYLAKHGEVEILEDTLEEYVHEWFHELKIKILKKELL